MIKVYGNNVLVEACDPFATTKSGIIINATEGFTDSGFQTTKESLQYGKVKALGADVKLPLFTDEIIAFSKYSLDIVHIPGVKEGALGVVRDNDIRTGWTNDDSDQLNKGDGIPLHL